MGLLDFKNTLQQAKKDLLDKPKEELLGNKNEILDKDEKSEESNLIEFERENFFPSVGVNKNILRHYQALWYGQRTYGMDCNACCMMYFLQSYGLIPPNMSRKQLEYLFTPLNPPKTVDPKKDKSAYSPNSSPKNNEGIKWEESIVKPTPDNLFKGLFNSTEGFLRGLEGSGAIFPHTTKGIEQLYTIVNRFYSLTQTNEYKFLAKDIKNGYYSLNYEGLSNKYSALQSGMEESYFQKDVIFVGIALTKFDIEHYCIIGNAPSSQTFEGIDFWVYPADDPYYRTTTVFVPKSTIQNVNEVISKLGNSEFLIYPNCAIGV